MKIGVNSRFLQQHQSGIPFFIKSLYSELTQISNNNYFFFQTKKISDSFKNTKILPIGNYSFTNVLFDMMLINRLISDRKIHIFHGPSNLLPYHKVLNVKYVVTIHDLSFLLYPQNDSKLFYLYYKFGIARSLQNADIVVADSISTKKDIISIYGTPEEKIKVVYLGVNKDFLRNKKTSKIIQDDYFFTLTTHPKRKNIYSILEIMASNKNSFNYIRFVIAGLIPTIQKKELEDAINKLGLQKKVILLGYVTENQLINLYQHAKFFIYPSFYEGFGLPVVEASICKCPVLASNTSSLPELLPDREWLFDPTNKLDMIDKINKMLNLSPELKSKLIDKNYKYARKFQWKKTAQQYLQIFNSL